MHRIIIAALTSILISSLSTASIAEQYYLNANNTQVTWHTRILGLFTVSGTCRATGKITFNQVNPRQSKAYVKISTNSIETGSKSVNKILKGPKFFNSKKQPYIRFRSNKTYIENNVITKMSGTLTIRNISKPATLTIDQVSNTPYRSVSAHTTISRSQFGMRAYPHLVSDKVYIKIKLEEP